MSQASVHVNNLFLGHPSETIKLSEYLLPDRSFGHGLRDEDWTANVLALTSPELSNWDHPPMNNKQQLTRTARVTPGNSKHPYRKDNAIEVPSTFPFFWLLGLEGFNRPDFFSSVLENQRRSGPSARTPALSNLPVLLTDNVVTFYWGFSESSSIPSHQPADSQQAVRRSLLWSFLGTALVQMC